MTRLNWSLSPQATANFGLVLIVLMINSIVVHRNTIALHTSEESINHTHEVLSKTQMLFCSLSEAESGVRGYAMTGDDSFLTIYHQVVDQIAEQSQFLLDAVSDNPIQIERVEELTQSVDRRLTHLNSVITARSTDGFEAARDQMISGVGRREMDRIRQVIDALQTEETRLLGLRTLQQENSLFIVLAANLAALSVGTALTIVAWYLVERELRKRRIAEENAHAQRQNLWVTLTSIADGVIVTDATGRVKLANPIALELIGNPQDIVDRPLADVFSMIDEVTRNPVMNSVSRVLASGMTAGNVDRIVLRQEEGAEIPIEQTAAPIRDDLGKITGVVFVFRDCSVRRRFEKELCQREQHFRRLFETPLIGIAVGTSNGNVLQANDAFLDLIGFRSEDFDPRKSSWVGIPTDQTPLDDDAKLELRQHGVCKPFERILTRADGVRVPVLISAARLMDELDRIVVFVTDLTQSKRAEAALRESDARFRVLSECMPQKVWTARPDGQLDYLNTMLLEYAGLPAEQLRGWGWSKLIHPDDLRMHLDSWKQSLATGDMFEIEHRVRKHTGEYRWHLARALPVYQPDGQVTMWVGTNTDIHDQKQAEELLLEEHHRKDHFLALLAHELRNPLAPLSNAVQVLSSLRNDPASSASLLEIMQRQVRQMTRLIDDLLDLARINTGRMRLRKERIEAKTVVSAAVEAVQPLISERLHQLTVTVPPEELWLDADSTRLTQILTNLLHNAAKYTDPEGALTFIVEPKEPNVLFRVRDNGPGITKDMLTKIFDVFTQVEWTLDRAHGGLGIGLTLVRTLVELHGGSVTALSDGLGTGSEFVVQLPLIENPDRPVTQSEAKLAESTSSLPILRVLVVDDVQASAKTLALMLQTLGQNTEVAFDGTSAIVKATENHFDVIFLDIAMPGMDGLEVARRLRAIPELTSVKLIALTGFGQNEDRSLCLQAGFNEHLTKPMSMDLLRVILQRAASEGEWVQPC